MGHSATTTGQPYYAVELADLPADGLEPPEEHPDDREAYYVFAELMGWKAEWEDLGTVRDVPGPGQLPFVAAFRRVRQMASVDRWCGQDRPAVDHWAEWLKVRERQRAEREAHKGKRRRK